MTTKGPPIELDPVLHGQENWNTIVKEQSISVAVAIVAVAVVAAVVASIAPAAGINDSAS